MSVIEFFGTEGPLAKKFPGYAPREQQIELAKNIEEAMRTETPMIGEAPTGVGKSFAALVPAFELIKKYNSPVLVVTSSILLQEQYFNKDVPLLEDMFGIKTDATLIKGKSNYVCLQKTVNGKQKAGTTKNAAELEVVQRWAATTKTGDVSELDFVPSLPVWQEFAIADEHECVGKDCPLFNQCFYYNRRREMKSSKLIICNYHYFFTALDNEKMLPPGIKAVIMDEGHEISTIARDMQERTMDINTYKRMNQMLAQAQAKAKVLMGDIPIAEEIELPELLATHQKVMNDVAEYFIKNKTPEKESLTFQDREKKDMVEIGKPHYEQLERSIQLLERYLVETGLNQNMRHEWDNYYDVSIIQWQLAQERYLQALEDRLELCEKFFGGPNLEEETFLMWLEAKSYTGVALKTKPFTAAPMTSRIFARNPEDRPLRLMGATPIVISATLSVNGNFRHIQNDLGIQTLMIECRVDSPFNLTDNMLWYLPKDIPSGVEGGHLTATLSEMVKIIRVSEGRSLCLFTSNKAMQAASHHFRKVLPKEIEVIVQNEIPKQLIIDKLKDNPHTVVIATKSFFTGVDIQGQNLSAVLIDKLPFPMVGDPVNDYLMSDNRGFFKYTLPETIISIKQGFGRLNRTTADKGIVTVFDGRLETASYNEVIFGSFPFKLTATRDFETVRTYLEEIINGADL